MIAGMARSGHDPIAKFIRWLEDARRVRIPNYEAMALATAARSGKISVRFVLLKGIDERGFVFFTDARSHKGHELRDNPRASLALYWQPRGRQVRVEGRAEEVTPAEADAYWPSRCRGRANLPRARRIRVLGFARALSFSRGSPGSPGSSGAGKSRDRRAGPGFVCVLTRSSSGRTANIACTTVRSTFDAVVDGDVICSSPLDAYQT